MSTGSQIIDNKLPARYLTRAHRLLMIAWACAWVILLAWGWSIRDEDYVSASSGLGYLLGLTGGLMLLLQLSYSLRKRWRPMRKLLHLRYWFRLHMTLGVLAPTCILFHSRFSFGSPNSTVALICLLTVALSGLFGRFLYNRIHAGVYGKKIKLVQVRRDFKTLQDAINRLVMTEKQRVRAARIFAALEELIVAQQTANLHSLWRGRVQARKIGRALRHLMQAIEQHHAEHGAARENVLRTKERIHNCTDVMLAILEKLPGLHLFERLFSLWHVVHLPIFGLMIITAITHVVVVHMY